MPQQQNQGQQTEPEAEARQEGDALDELDAALGPDGDGNEAAEPEEWAPPTREQWEALQAAHAAELEKERGKLKRARTQAQRLREGRGTSQQAPAEDGDGTAQQGSDPQIAVWQARAVRSAAKAELIDRGADAGMVDLLLGQLRSERIDFDEDDNPDLDEWLDAMQEKYPAAFAKPEPAAGGRRAMGAVDQGSAKGRPVGRQLSYGERVLENSRAAMQGRPRRRTP